MHGIKHHEVQKKIPSIFCGEDTVGTTLDAPNDHEGLAMCFLTWCIFVFTIARHIDILVYIQYIYTHDVLTCTSFVRYLLMNSWHSRGHISADRSSTIEPQTCIFSFILLMYPVYHFQQVCRFQIPFTVPI